MSNLTLCEVCPVGSDNCDGTCIYDMPKEPKYIEDTWVTDGQATINEDF